MSDKQHESNIRAIQRLAGIVSELSLDVIREALEKTHQELCILKDQQYRKDQQRKGIETLIERLR